MLSFHRMMYILCAVLLLWNQALTSLPSKNTVTYNLAVVIRNLPGFKEEPGSYIALRTAEISQKEATLERFPEDN